MEDVTLVFMLSELVPLRGVFPLLPFLHWINKTCEPAELELHCHSFSVAVSLQHVIFHSEAEEAQPLPWLNGAMNEVISALCAHCLFCLVQHKTQGKLALRQVSLARFGRNRSRLLRISTFLWKCHFNVILRRLVRGPKHLFKAMAFEAFHACSCAVCQ